MIRLCIVDDNETDRAVLLNHIQNYQKESGDLLEVTTFSDGLSFVSEYTGDFDLIFFDIEMPHMDGLEAAHRLRAIDPTVGIIFVTNMAQYAIKGYEVEAIDFMVKPVGYHNFVDKLKKALRYLHRDIERVITIQDSERIIKLKVSEVQYIEKDRNYLNYCTINGLYRIRGTLKSIESDLVELGFSKNNSGCLVNLRHIQRIERDMIYIGDTVLSMSRNQRKNFVEAYMNYLGGI